MLIPDIELKAKIEEFIRTQGLKKQGQQNSMTDKVEAADSSNDVTPMVTE